MGGTALAGHFKFTIQDGVPTLEFHADPGAIALPAGYPVSKIALEEGDLKVAVETKLGTVRLHVDVSAGTGAQAG